MGKLIVPGDQDADSERMRTHAMLDPMHHRKRRALVASILDERARQIVELGHPPSYDANIKPGEWLEILDDLLLSPDAFKGEVAQLPALRSMLIKLAATSLAALEAL
jgi:hypothetical protein